MVSSGNYGWSNNTKLLYTLVALLPFIVSLIVSHSPVDTRGENDGVLYGRTGCVWILYYSRSVLLRVLTFLVPILCVVIFPQSTYSSSCALISRHVFSFVRHSIGVLVVVCRD